MIASVLLLSRCFFVLLNHNLRRILLKRCVDLSRAKHSAMFFLIATVVLCSFKHSCVLVHIYFNDIQVDICVYHIYIYMYICKYTNFCKILLTVKIDSNLILKVITLKN